MSFGAEQSNNQPQTDAMVCGQPMDGASVGKPGEQVECRNQAFDLHHPGHKGPKGEVAIVTICPCCNTNDPISVYMTSMEGAPWVVAANVPDLMAKRFPPGLLVCECGQWRFFLIDSGNEIATRCAACSKKKQLGFDAGNAVGEEKRQLGSWGEDQPQPQLPPQPQQG